MFTVNLIRYHSRCMPEPVDLGENCNQVCCVPQWVFNPTALLKEWEYYQVYSVSMLHILFNFLKNISRLSKLLPHKIAFIECPVKCLSHKCDLGSKIRKCYLDSNKAIYQFSFFLPCSPFSPKIIPIFQTPSHFLILFSSPSHGFPCVEILERMTLDS